MSHASIPKSVARTPPSAPMAVLWAGAAAVVPTIIRLAMDHVVSDLTIFPAYFPFVLATATFLGWRSAILATILSGLAANYMFMGGRFAFSADPRDVVGTLVFLVSAAVVVVGVEYIKAAARAHYLDLQNPGGGAARHPLGRGPGLVAALLLALASWIAMIWGVRHAVHLLT